MKKSHHIGSLSRLDVVASAYESARGNNRYGHPLSILTRQRIAFVLLLVVAQLLLWSPNGYSQSQPVSPLKKHTVYVPLVSRVETDDNPQSQLEAPADGEEPSGLPNIKTDCGFSAYEQELADLLAKRPAQKRSSLTCDPILISVARVRARDMGVRDYFGHVNPDGFGPNFLVTQAGYPLPDGYDRSPTANQIEAIAAGSDTPTQTWSLLMQSATHRAHLLAETPAFLAQTAYGIGYVLVPGSYYEAYWVLITTPPR